MIRNQTQFAIWDLDNCLSDDRARIRLIDWAAPNPDVRYAAYHAACAHDPARNLEVFHAVSQLAKPVIFTARPESARADTTRWARCELDVLLPLIYMRPAGDHRPGAEVKADMLAAFRALLAQRAATKATPFGPESILAAFDDREDIVDMYRAMGLNAALLSIHSVCAYTAPKAAQ